nr:hypothetical protein CFP56_69347 [Quercus suber]
MGDGSTMVNDGIVTFDVRIQHQGAIDGHGVYIIVDFSVDSTLTCGRRRIKNTHSPAPSCSLFGCLQKHSFDLVSSMYPIHDQKKSNGVTGHETSATLAWWDI